MTAPRLWVWWSDSSEQVAHAVLPFASLTAPVVTACGRSVQLALSAGSARRCAVCVLYAASDVEDES